MPTADAGNQWQAYHKGWKAGAVSRVMDSVFLAHDDAKIKAAYEQGYQDGRLALNAAMQKAADRYGYRINILRLCDGTGAAAEA